MFILVMIIVGIIFLITPWLEFLCECYLLWTFDKQDEIKAKWNGEKQRRKL